MKPVVSLCTNFISLKAHPKMQKDEKVRGKIDGTGGRHVWKNGNKSLIVLSGSEGLEEIEELAYMTFTSYEDIFGYTRQVEIDGIPQFGDDIIQVVHEHTIQVISGYEDDLTRPIPVMVAVYEEWERVFNDMEGNEVRIPATRLTGYQHTGEYDGYFAKPVYSDKVVPERTYTYKNPIMEDIPKVTQMWNQYKSVYPRKTVQTEHGPYTPSKLFSIPLGYDMSHLNA